MKTMSCEQMGGPCDHKIVASTPKEMIDAGMKHLEKEHPEIAKKMKDMSAEENEKWNDSFMATWEMAPTMQND